MGVDVTGIGAAVTGVKDILKMFFPDKTEEEIAKMNQAFAMVQNQVDVDKAEAQSTDPLQHWRGGLGWVCTLSYLNDFVIMPYAKAFGVNLPSIDSGSLFTLTLGMLGLGSMHVYQTVKGAT